MVLIKSLSLITLLFIFITACNQNNNTQNRSDNPSDTNQIVQYNKQDIEQLYRNKCLICHDLGTSEANAIAPPMVSVQRRYKMSYDKKEDFVKAMVAFTENPHEDKVLMTKAKEKFNIMPKLGYNQKDLEQIASYIFENELPQPAWYDEHFKKEHGSFKTVQNVGSNNPDVLLYNKCVICHQKSKLQTKQLAPLISEFTSVYKQKYKSKEDFVKAITNFVSQPQKDKALLSDAVNTYNLMPKMNYNVETIKAIASYLYDNSKENISKNIAKISPQLAPQEQNPESVYNSRCKICHDVDRPRNEMLAPPMVNIKKKYSRVYPNKEDFIKGIVNFTKEPELDKAMMFGALKQFELMPQLNYPENELKMAAEYIYNTEFKKPEWFK
ncbi:MAG: c-type cytochrome [Bacteroidales bacterium]|nr:c-type cytochrome [Bacteroidales bacterium]